MSRSLARLVDLPRGFLDSAARDLHDVLPGPALIELAGRRAPPLFVSILLHGNEDVGLQAIQRVLRRHTATGLPRSLALFVGNVLAAKSGLRRLDSQPDFNRVWPGTIEATGPETRMMAQVTRTMRERGIFASVDLHNNTGLNPHYACVTRLDDRTLQLASLFSRTVVFFRTPVGVQSAAFAEFGPAITCECGKAGDEAGIAHATELLEACLHLETLPDHPVREGDLHLFHTIATLRTSAGVSMSFDEQPADLVFRPDLDHLNFRELAADTALAHVRSRDSIRAFGERGEDVTRSLLHVQDGQLRLTRKLMPAMLTRDEQVIRQDCLCYLMERLTARACGAP